MSHLFTSIFDLFTYSISSPLGLSVLFLVAFTGELGVSPPAALEIAFLTVGVELAHGKFIGLVLFPIVIIAALIGTSISFWLSQQGAKLFMKFAHTPHWAQGEKITSALRNASPMTVGLLRQLPGSQLPVTVLWASIRARRKVLLQGVALSVFIHGGVQVAIGFASGKMFGDSEKGHALTLAFVIALILSLALVLGAELIRRFVFHTNNEKHANT